MVVWLMVCVIGLWNGLIVVFGMINSVGLSFMLFDFYLRIGGFCLLVWWVDSVAVWWSCLVHCFVVPFRGFGLQRLVVVAVIC